MHSPVIRFLIVLALFFGLPDGLAVRPVHASIPSGNWQVLGAARNLPTLYRPTGLTVDPNGDVYVADAGNFRVVEIGPHGRLLAHFGEADLRPGPGVPALPDGQAAMGPRSLAVDGRGTLYVADSSNRYVRVFSPQHHLVGDWPITIPGATVLQMAVAVGARGNVIVAIAAQVSCSVPLVPSYCATYYVVQRRSPSGAILGQFHSAIGPSGQAVSPPAISQIADGVDSRGDIYVATSGVLACYKSCPSFDSLVKHRFDGKVLARWSSVQLDPSADWAALAVGGSGNVFLADDFSHRVEKRTPAGKVVARWSFGSLFPAIVTGPSGVAVDRNGAVYVSDTGSGRILKLSSSGKLLTQWGAGGADAGRFWFPSNVSLDAHGQLWVDDALNRRVQVLGTDGRFRVQFAVAHAGPAMALDQVGNVYLGQLLNRTVYISKFSSTGKLRARWGGLHLAELPTGIAIASSGDMYVAGVFYFGGTASLLPLNGENILRLSSSGRQLGLSHVSSEATASGIGVDTQENSYIANGQRLEKRSPDGVLLASWRIPNLELLPPNPVAITLDPVGNVYLAATSRSVIEEVGPTGTLEGSWGFQGSYPGQFHQPGGIAVGPGGTMYVADTDNHRIQKLIR